MAHTVTPNRTHSFCDKRLRDANGCWCHRAQYSGRCQSCHKQISLGDCIQSNISGWVHVKCPIGNGSERGVRTIEDGFNNNVDYGSSFLKRLTMMDGEQRSMPSPLRLTFNDEQEDDTKMPAKASKEKKRRHIEITQESDEERELGDEDNELDDDDNEEGCSNKRAKHEEDAILAELIDNPQGNYADQMRTDEQMAILSHEPERGDVVVVNALAGCGKTTTIALLCNKILTEHPDSKCLYLVYNTEAGEEAMQSNKFPKDNMEIRTTHAYVLRHLFSVENMFKVQPTGDYSIDNIIECLDLRRECREIFKKTLLHVGGERKLEKRVKVIAGYIRNTIKNYQASADATLNRNHVFWRAKNRSDLTSRTMWRKKVSVSKYVHWASEVFSRVSEECMNIRNGGRNSGIDIPHDAYLKVAQVENLVIPFDVLCIDEAQDMTACQADLFWGLHQRSDKIIYLFGDRYQQIYRFRGASRSFRDMVDESNPKFTLTGTFRFGKNIANCASCVLRSLGGSPLHGRSTDDGRVILVEDDDDGEEEEDTAMHRGVVLCRSQNGIFRYLYTHSPDRWCYLSGGISNIQDPKQWQLDLEEFVQGNRTTFTHKGETFESIPGIKDYIDDEGDIDLYRTLTLLQFLVAQGKSIQEFFSDLRASYFPMQQDECPDQYNGIVMSTVHKAKGLEFEDVLIYDDFSWKTIMSSVINEAKHCDEANILYVAITRSKHNLYLTKEANNCLQYLLDHVKVQPSSMFSLESSKEKLGEWQPRWEAFKKNCGTIESINDVIFPPEWDNEQYPLALHCKMSLAEQRQHVRHFLRAYHPDKFLSRFGHAIQSSMIREEIKKVLEEITRKCTDILSSLQGEDED